MDNLAAMRVLVRVVETGGFSAAGRALGMAPSSVSRRIGELEDLLGVRLLHRTTRKLSLTEAGRPITSGRKGSCARSRRRTSRSPRNAPPPAASCA